MWNMMNGMRLGIDFSAGGYFPLFSAGVHTACLRCCHPFGVPFFVVVFHWQGFTPPAYDATTPLGFCFATWFASAGVYTTCL